MGTLDCESLLPIWSAFIVIIMGTFSHMGIERYMIGSPKFSVSKA
jgi:hypothetical protein